MSKQIFRFLRGELLNSFYIKNMQTMMNSFTENVKKFFIDFHNQQFTLKEMSADTIYNLGKFAGVFLPILSVGEGYGSLKLTESAKYNGIERSERGLFSDKESFNFVHTEHDDYTDDINTLATVTDRSSMVGENDSLQGYIDSTDTKVLDDKGVVRPNHVLSTPPAGVAYSDFYGSKFLYLSEMLNETRSISIELYYELFKVMQYIRYNGESIRSLCRLISAICPNGLVKIERIEKLANVACFVLYYSYDANMNIDYKVQRLATFKYIMSQKFHQFTLEEVIKITGV